MTSAGESKQISKLFTKEAHQKYVTVIGIVQNVFYHGRVMRTISLYAHYLLLYKNPRDKSQMLYFAQQTFPENSKFLPKCYEHETQEPHSDLLLDLHPETPEQYIVLSNIFPGEQIRFFLPVSL